MSNQKRILVLGVGLVGREIVTRLSNYFLVTAADINVQALEQLADKQSVRVAHVDFSDTKRIKNLAHEHDIVVGAMPGAVAFKAVKAVVEAEKDIVDISFFEEDPFLLDDLARKNNVTLVPDCGVAPGMSNFLLGHETENMNVEEFVCLVGGLPFQRTLPWEYKASWSPDGVIDEYTRPARLVVNSKVVTMEALSEPEFIEFPGIGTLEAFNSDGLRTLLRMNVPNMKEMTLRYPGHRDLVVLLRDIGFFNDKPVVVGETSVAPIEVTAQLLKAQWKLKNTDDEFTVMRLIMKGHVDNKQRKVVYDLFDRRDQKTGASSMARTTGYTCAAVTELLVHGKIKEKGVVPPECLGKNKKHVAHVLGYLKRCGVTYQKTERLSA